MTPLKERIRDLVILAIFVSTPFIIRFIFGELYFYNILTISLFIISIYILLNLPYRISVSLGYIKSIYTFTQILGICTVTVILLIKLDFINCSININSKLTHGLIELICVILGIVSTYFSITFGNICGRYINIPYNYINVISELVKLSIIISVIITISISFIGNVNQKWLSQVIVNFCGPVILMTTSFIFGLSVSTIVNENIKLIFMLSSLLLLSAINTVYYAFGAMYYYTENHIDFLLFFFSIYCLFPVLYLISITKYKDIVLLLISK